MFLRKIAGIYKITHKATEQYYIGQSVDIFSRWGHHYHDLMCGKHSSKKFVEIWNNSNPDDFTFEIICKFSMTEFSQIHVGKKKVEIKKLFKSELLKLEKEWMKKYSKNFALNANNKHFS